MCTRDYQIVRVFVHILTNSTFSLTPSPTLFARPNRARSSAMPSSTRPSSPPMTSPSSFVSVSALLNDASYEPLLPLGRITGSAILTRIACVGRDSSAHKNETNAPGIGVVISAGEYRRFTGYTFVLGGADRRLGERGRMARPFEVVHSGKTTIIESGFSFRSVESGTSRAPGGGTVIGPTRAR